MIKKCKKWCLSLLMLALSATAFSQNDLQRHEISLGYGVLPASDYIDSFSDAFVSGLSGLRDKNDKSMGAISLMYNYRLNKTFGIGGVLSYSHRSKDWVSGDKGNDATKQKFDYITVMPRVKGEWVHSDIFTLYSAVALGVTLYKDKVGNQSDSSVRFGWQVSALGFEVGKSIAGFAELGVGQLGVAIVGVRARF